MNTTLVVIIVVVLIILFFGNRLRGAGGKLPGNIPSNPAPKNPLNPNTPGRKANPEVGSGARGGDGADDLLRDLKGSNQKKEA